jgi:4-amino-4-deoxy-L-arabinose transferase-like glycosyltransferase
MESTLSWAKARSAGAWIAIASTALLLFVLRYPSLYEPRWYGDEGIFAAIAQSLRSGGTLYADAWDNKPPLIFFTYAGIQSLFGTSVMALHIASLVVALATQAVVMAIALMLGRAGRAAVAGGVFAFVMGTPLLEGNLAMTETFMILPSSLGVLTFVVAQQRAEVSRDWFYVAAGVLFGIAAGYKQVAVFDAGAVGVMIWLTHERPLRAMALVVAGFGGPQVLFLALFAALGALPQYWYAIVGSLGLYSEIGPAQGPFVKFIGYLPALLVVAWLVHRRRNGSATPITVLPALWLSFALAGSMSSAFAFPHYLQQAAPALALTVACSPFALERDELRRLMLGVTAVLIAAVVFGQFALAYRERKQLNPVDYYQTFASHQWGTMSDQDYDYAFDGKVVAVNDIVSYMKADGAGTTLYTWSELPWVYPAGGFTNPARYYTSFLGEVVPGAKREILRDLDAHPPIYVLVSDDTFAPFEELSGFLASRYALVHEQGDWHLYRLSSARGNLESAPGG